MKIGMGSGVLPEIRTRMDLEIGTRVKLGIDPETRYTEDRWNKSWNII